MGRGLPRRRPPPGRKAGRRPLLHPRDRVELRCPPAGRHARHRRLLHRPVRRRRPRGGGGPGHHLRRGPRTRRHRAGARPCPPGQMGRGARGARRPPVREPPRRLVRLPPYAPRRPARLRPRQARNRRRARGDLDRAHDPHDTARTRPATDPGARRALPDPPLRRDGAHRPRAPCPRALPRQGHPLLLLHRPQAAHPQHGALRLRLPGGAAGRRSPSPGSTPSSAPR